LGLSSTQLSLTGKNYLKHLTETGGLEMGSEKYLSKEEFTVKAGELQNLDLINYALTLGGTLDWIIRGTARGNHSTKLESYLNLHPEHRSEAVFGAAEGNHTSLLNQLLTNVSVNSFYYCSVLSGAVRGGHLDLYHQYDTSSFGKNLYDLAYQAGRSGNGNMIAYFQNEFHPDEILLPLIKGSLEGGHSELTQKLRSTIQDESILTCLDELI